MKTPQSCRPGSEVGGYRVDGQDRRGRDGQRVRRASSAHRQARRDQGAARRALRRRRRRSSASCRRRGSVNQIGHPNIVDVFAFGAAARRPQLLRDGVAQGETLRARLDRAAAAARETLEILDAGVRRARGGARAAASSTATSSPTTCSSCAVRGGARCVKLLDFGIAKLATRDDPRRCTHDAQPGIVMGTPGVHVAGAGARQERRPAHRHLRARRARVRDADRPRCRSWPTTRWI